MPRGQTARVKKGAVDRLDETRRIGFIEAVFSLELDDQNWLLSVLSALSALHGPERKYAGFFYDASNAHDFRLWNVCTLGTSAELEAALRASKASADSEYRTSTHCDVPVSGPRASGSPRLKSMLEELERCGWRDVFNIDDSDRSGTGCLLVMNHRAGEFAVPPADLFLDRRLAKNLTTAFRCRSRLAICGPGTSDQPHCDREVVSAKTSSVRQERAQRTASTRIARRRLQASLTSPEAGLPPSQREAWRNARNMLPPAARGRLTFVDTFEEEGSRYIVAREDRARAQGFTTLTERERQIVRYGAQGFTNKQIAHALGISDATVRVLMARAAGRVGVRTRRELLAHPELREVAWTATEAGI